MVETIKKAHQHSGFSVVNVLQPCVTFDKKTTYQYYMQHSYKLEATYVPNNKLAALEKAFEVEQERYPLGVLYESDRSAYHIEAVANNGISLINQPRFQDFEALVEEFI